MEFRYQAGKGRENTLGSSFSSKGLFQSQANGAGMKCFNQGSKPQAVMAKRQRTPRDLKMQDIEEELILNEIAFKICMDEEMKIERALQNQLADINAGANNIGKKISFDIGLGLKDNFSPSINAPPSLKGISNSLLYEKHSISPCGANNPPPVRTASRLRNVAEPLLSGKNPSSVCNGSSLRNFTESQFNASANDFSAPVQGYNTSVSNDFNKPLPSDVYSNLKGSAKNHVPLREACNASDLRESNEPFMRDTHSSPTGSENTLPRSTDDHDNSDFIDFDEEMPPQVSSKPTESENKASGPTVVHNASDLGEYFNKSSALNVQSKPSGTENKLPPTLQTEPKDESSKEDKSSSSHEEDNMQELTKEKEKASAAITWSCSLCKDFKGTSSKDVFDEHLKSMLHKANEYNHKVEQQSSYGADMLTAKESDNPLPVKENEKIQTKRAMKPRSSILKKAKVQLD